MLDRGTLTRCCCLRQTPYLAPEFPISVRGTWWLSQTAGGMRVEVRSVYRGLPSLLQPETTVHLDATLAAYQ